MSHSSAMWPFLRVYGWLLAAALVVFDFNGLLDPGTGRVGPVYVGGAEAVEALCEIGPHPAPPV